MHRPITEYHDLDDLLADLTRNARTILGDDFVGSYLTGSFALRDADLSSDCDFLVVTARPLTPDEEAALRAYHAEVPTRDGYWPINLEGSYAPIDDLRTIDRVGNPWLFVNRGHREMEYSDHCNCLETRWTLREGNVVIDGPPTTDFVAEIPAESLRRKMRKTIPSFMDDLRTWAPTDIIWTQRYTVESISRMLYTLETGRVTSKRGGMEWALDHVPDEWHPLIRQAIADRPLAWDDPVRPGAFEEAERYAAWAASDAAAT